MDATEKMVLRRKVNKSAIILDTNDKTRHNFHIHLLNENYFEDLDKDKFTKIIDETKKGHQPKPGSYKGRLNSAPEIKRTTLNNL